AVTCPGEQKGQQVTRVTKIRIPVEYDLEPGKRIGVPADRKFRDCAVILRWPIVSIQAQSLIESGDGALRLPHRKKRVSHVVPGRPVPWPLLYRTLVIRNGAGPVAPSLLDYAKVVPGFHEIRIK